MMSIVALDGGGSRVVVLMEVAVERRLLATVRRLLATVRTVAGRLGLVTAARRPLGMVRLQ